MSLPRPLVCVYSARAFKKEKENEHFSCVCYHRWDRYQTVLLSTGSGQLLRVREPARGQVIVPYLHLQLHRGWVQSSGHFQPDHGLDDTNWITISLQITLPKIDVIFRCSVLTILYFSSLLNFFYTIIDI